MILELGKSLALGETEISRLSRRNFREGKPNESKTGVSHLIHVFPAEAGIQDNSPFLLDPGLRRGDDEYQNAKVL